MTAILSTTVILQLRLYALYSMNRLVLIVMSTMFMATLITSTSLLLYGVFNITGLHLLRYHQAVTLTSRVFP